MNSLVDDSICFKQRPLAFVRERCSRTGGCLLPIIVALVQIKIGQLNSTSGAGTANETFDSLGDGVCRAGSKGRAAIDEIELVQQILWQWFGGIVFAMIAWKVLVLDEHSPISCSPIQVPLRKSKEGPFSSSTCSLWPIFSLEACGFLRVV